MYLSIRPIKVPNKLLVTLGLVAAITLSGCATTGSSMLGNGADERLTQGQSAQFFSRSGLQSCVAGAAVAITACMLSNSSNKAACSAIAGVAACGVAMGTNYYLDARRAQYSNTNERLQAITKDVEADTQHVQRQTQNAQAVIKENQRQMAQLEQQIKNNAVEQEYAQKELAQIDRNIDVLNKQLDNMNERVENYQSVSRKEREDGASPAQIKKLDQQINSMNRQVAVLRQEVTSLYEQRNAINLG